jgi:hypothetical protein
MEVKKLSRVQMMVAKQLAATITECQKYVVKQTEVVDMQLLGAKLNAFDLRQNIQALETGKRTLNHIINHFEENVGMTYDDYCTANPEVMKADRVEDMLLSAITQLIDSKLESLKDEN